MPRRRRGGVGGLGEDRERIHRSRLDGEGFPRREFVPGVSGLDQYPAAQHVVGLDHGSVGCSGPSGAVRDASTRKTSYAPPV